jgi:type IV pilus assembly protein PilF
MRQAHLLLLVAMLGAGCVQQGHLPAPGVPRSAPDPADADRRAAPRLELAALHFSRGNYETALQEVNLALAAKPDLGPAYNLRGLIQAAMGEERLADESFLRALALNPRDADAMHNRGWVFCQFRRFDEANALFDQAVAQPQYRDPIRTLIAQGVCHARAGKLELAEQKLSRAFELDATNPTAAINLAEVLYRRGDYERARFYIRRVNGRDEFSSAQSLWLALRIENRLGNRPGVEEFGRELRNRFPQAPETVAFDRGRIDE